MGVRVAYGSKEGIQPAIDSGVLPKDTIIITNDSLDPEMLFYDKDGNLKPVTERTRFETLTDAEQWATQYPCKGLVFTVHNGAEWVPYVVQNDNSLTPFKGEIGNVADIKRIDGGDAAGV